MMVVKRKQIRWQMWHNIPIVNHSIHGVNPIHNVFGQVWVSDTRRTEVVDDNSIIEFHFQLHGTNAG